MFLSIFFGKWKITLKMDFGNIELEYIVVSWNI